MTEALRSTVSPRGGRFSGSETNSDSGPVRCGKDSSTASQHSADDPHDLPPLVGAPLIATANSRYAVAEKDNLNGMGPAGAGGGGCGVGMQNSRSNSLYESHHQSSPSLRRRLKLLIRQKSEPDMLIGRTDLGMNSPGRHRRGFAPSPPPGESPRSTSGSDCNSPRMIRKPRSFHGQHTVPNSPLTPRSIENSPRIGRRSMSIGPVGHFTFPGEQGDTTKKSRSHSIGPFAIDAPGSKSEGPLNAIPSGAPDSPFTARRGINLRKASGSRPSDSGLGDSLPAVNGHAEGCVTQPISSYDGRRSLNSDDDGSYPGHGFVSIETAHGCPYDHATPEDRLAHARGHYHSLRKGQQQSPNQLPHSHHHHHSHPNPHQNNSPSQVSHPHSSSTDWVGRGPLADCIPPPANSPTRDVNDANFDPAAEGPLRDSFTNSYSSAGSVEKVSKPEETSNDDNGRRLAGSLYDIDEARELAEESPENEEAKAKDGKEQTGCHHGNRAAHQENGAISSNVVESSQQSNVESNAKQLHHPENGEENNNTNGNSNQIGHRVTNGHGVGIQNGQKGGKDHAEQEGVGEDEEEEEEEEEDESDDDSYDQGVPEYQKAPMSTKMRVKNWLAGLEGSDNESSSRIDSFLPEIMEPPPPPPLDADLLYVYGDRWIVNETDITDISPRWVHCTWVMSHIE